MHCSCLARDLLLPRVRSLAARMDMEAAEAAAQAGRAQAGRARVRDIEMCKQAMQQAVGGYLAQHLRAMEIMWVHTHEQPEAYTELLPGKKDNGGTQRSLSRKPNKARFQKPISGAGAIAMAEEVASKAASGSGSQAQGACAQDQRRERRGGIHQLLGGHVQDLESDPQYLTEGLVPYTAAAPLATDYLRLVI